MAKTKDPNKYLEELKKKSQEYKKEIKMIVSYLEKIKDKKFKAIPNVLGYSKRDIEKTQAIALRNGLVSPKYKKENGKNKFSHFEITEKGKSKLPQYRKVVKTDLGF